MKIGIVCYPTYGGSGVVATELGKALARVGHEVHFISYKQPFRLSSFEQNITFHEVSFTNYPLFEFPPYETALASKLVDAVKYNNLDIIHVHYAIPHASAAFLAKQILLSQGIHIPVVTTLHGTDITLVGKDVTYEPVVTFSINQSDGVTAVSDSLKKDTLDSFDITREIEVIPNFIDLATFQHSDKKHFKTAIAPEGEPILIHISNFRKVKRVQDVIDTFRQVVDRIPAKLLLVGDGPERKKAEQQCRDLGICGHIRFLGKQDAINELLSVADVFLMPSESESFGLAALEAMACEVPVISSDAGGLPEINIHNETGFMAEVGNTAQMAQYAYQLLTDKEKLAEFKKNALAQAKRFDIIEIMPLYAKYYEKVIEESKATVH
ncbi:UNVERIFIED_CONTAM: hypothetical protein GTU68_006076 [Idotea baltica]|nr:hypothetical protein [Idotea baltica]